MDRNEFELHLLDKMSEMQETLTEVRVEVGQLQIRSGLWGAIAGTIPAAIILMLEYIRAK